MKLLFKMLFVAMLMLSAPAVLNAASKLNPQQDLFKKALMHKARESEEAKKIEFFALIDAVVPEQISEHISIMQFRFNTLCEHDEDYVCITDTKTDTTRFYSRTVGGAVTPHLKEITIDEKDYEGFCGWGKVGVFKKTTEMTIPDPMIGTRSAPWLMTPYILKTYGEDCAEELTRKVLSMNASTAKDAITRAKTEIAQEAAAKAKKEREAAEAAERKRLADEAELAEATARAERIAQAEKERKEREAKDRAEAADRARQRKLDEDAREEREALERLEQERKAIAERARQKEAAKQKEKERLAAEKASWSNNKLTHHYTLIAAGLGISVPAFTQYYRDECESYNKEKEAADKLGETFPPFSTYFWNRLATTFKISKAIGVTAAGVATYGVYKGLNS